MALKYLRGVNLSGLEFNPGTVPGTAGTHYYAHTSADYAYFAGKGFNLVRIPFTWDRAQPNTMGPLDATYMGYIDQAIGYAAANGMQVVLDMHSFGRRYVPLPAGGFTNDFTSSAGSWTGGSLSGGRYISDQTTFASTMAGGDLNNPVAPKDGYAVTLDAYITAEDVGAGKTPALFIRAYDNGQPPETATYYQVTLDRYAQLLKWSKVVNGTATPVGEVSATISLNTAYTVVVDVNQSSPGNVVVKVNNTTYATFPADESIQHGRVSVVTSSAKAAIDNVTVDVGGDKTSAMTPGTYAVGSPQLPVETIADVWGKIAQRYTGNTTVWAYGVMNEPHDMPTSTTPLNYNNDATNTVMCQRAINAIRNYDTSAWVIIPLDDWGGFQGFNRQYGDNPGQWWNDPFGKTMIDAHYWFDSDRSGNYNTSWSQPLRDRIIGDVTPLLTWANARGIPVISGQYGVPYAATPDGESWRQDLDAFLDLLDQYGAHGTYWSAGVNFNATVSIEPRTGAAVDYNVEMLQMPILQAHLSVEITPPPDTPPDPDEPPPPVLPDPNNVPEGATDPGKPQFTFIDPSGKSWNLSSLSPRTGYFTKPGITGWGATSYDLTTDKMPRGGVSIRAIHANEARLTWPLHVWGETHLQWLDRYRNLKRAFLTTVQRNQTGTIIVSRPDGSARQIEVIYESGFDGEGNDEDWLWSNPVLTLMCPDAYWRDTTPTVIRRDFAPGSSFWNPFLTVSKGSVDSTVTVENPGEIGAWPEWTITGPCDAIVATNNTTKQTWTLTKSIVAGQTITVTTQRPTLRGPAAENLVNNLNWPTAYLWGLLPGRNDISFTVTGAALGTAIEVAFYPRYEGA